MRVTLLQESPQPAGVIEYFTRDGKAKPQRVGQHLESSENEQYDAHWIGAILVLTMSSAERMRKGAS